MITLTKQQRRTLELLATVPLDPWTPAQLAEALDTSSEGAAATASSLVRRGLARRLHHGVNGRRVVYSLSSKGAELLAYPAIVPTRH